MKTRLHIDRLVLRTQGLTPAAAEAAARALPRALAVHLPPLAGPQLGGPIPALTVTAARGDSPALIAHAIAARLANQSSA